MTGRAATTLERAIARAQEGVLETGTLLWTLAAGEIVFLNNSVPEAGAFPDDPLVLMRGDAQFLAVFTHSDLIPADYAADRTPVAIAAFELLTRIPPTSGLTVNPGSRLGFEVPAEGLQTFVADLLSTTVST